MADPPNIRTAGTGTEGGGFTKKIAGLPAWGWVAIATVGGIAVFMWLQNRKGGGSQSNAETPVDQNPEGLSTEQYESLLALLRDMQGAPSTPVPTPVPTPTPTGGGTQKPPVSNPKPTSKPDFVVVVPWKKKNPPWNSTLSGIAEHEKTTVPRLLRLNPSISNPNIIHPGQKIRVR